MTDDAELRARQIAALEEARSAVNRALALLREPGASVAAALAVEPDWRSLKEAAHACDVHPETMARQARAHGLGRRRDRVWRIDMHRVRAWEEGRPYTPLMSEDSASPGNLSDASDDSSAA